MPYTMPFGAHTGTRIEDLPDQYLEWICRQSWLREPLRGQLEREHLRRNRKAKTGEPRQMRLMSGDMRDRAAELVDAGFRTLSKKYHPDRGGQHEDMVLLSQAKEALQEILQGAA